MPESSAEMGVKETEGGPVFYHKKTDSRYVISFMLGIDENYYYDSETKKWHDGISQ